jgi:pyruvate oxidase
VEALQLEPEKFSVEQINAFKEKYQVHDMPTLRELLK